MANEPGTPPRRPLCARPRRPSRVFKAHCRAGGAPSKGGERRTRTVTLIRSSAFGAAPATLTGFTHHVGSPARYERAGDGRGRSNRNSPRRAARFPAGASRLAGSRSDLGKIECLPLTPRSHGVEPCHAPYEGAVAPCTPAELGNQGSNLDSSGPEPDVLPDYTIPHQPLSRILTMRGYCGRSSGCLLARTSPET